MLDESSPAPVTGGGANAGTESNLTALADGNAISGTPRGGPIGKPRGLGKTRKRAQNEGGRTGNARSCGAYPWADSYGRCGRRRASTFDRYYYAT